MELRSVQYFAEVADEGSITRAADKLGVAQPALTRRIKQLEAELGTQLLTRLPRGVRLTNAGREFLEHARRIVSEVARARDQVRGNPRAVRGRVVLGTSPTLAPLLLPGCVARARQLLPGVALKFLEGFSPQLLDALLAGRLDLAVTTNPPRSPGISLTPLLSEPLVVVSPPQARGTRRAYSITELSRLPMIISAGLRAVVDEQLAAFGAALRVEAEVDSIEAIRRLLLAGVGTSIMPVSVVHAELAARRLAAQSVEGANLHRILVLARPAAEPRSAAAAEVERLVRGEMNALAEAGLFKPPARRLKASRAPRGSVAG
ncbi:MAG: LysR family transcriptional regulator [Betaproteobacteria bacterium]|nr:LysR family transcriptional regulator [Betaproteobacteria bacterium]